MITTSRLTLKYGKRTLFEDVSIKFTPGNCYGLIGANGAGKSTFLKILSGEVESSSGEVSITPGERLAVLKQNHYEFEQYSVMATVLMGHKELYAVISERDELYAKPDFSDADGLRISELEERFEELDGWSAESEAATLLKGLGIPEDLQEKKMSELDGNDKVRVLLAQALFGNPDILLLDEPTNSLDLDSVMWLENFLLDFPNTVIVVSHDRHFLNKVCTHIADIDFGKIQVYVGNYDFWYQSSQLAQKQLRDANKKKEEKMKELQDFIMRFSSNASKAKQATSRKKLLDKINLDDIKPSTRKYPYIDFKPAREAGKNVLKLEKLTIRQGDRVLVKELSMEFNRGDKVAMVGPDEQAKIALMKVLTGEGAAEFETSGNIVWGDTISVAYLPRDHGQYFTNDLNLIDWLRQYSKEKEENFVRGYLGRMLFSGEEAAKKASVLSGGEKMRCMFSRMMLSGANFVILDEPTNHLDLESITSLNTGLEKFEGNLLFVSKDHELNNSTANRILEVTSKGFLDRSITFDEYFTSEELREQRKTLYE